MKRPSPTTLAALHARVEERHTENQRRFDHIDQQIAELAKDVRSLLDSRSQARGMWRMMVIAGTIVGAAVSAIITWMRG